MANMKYFEVKEKLNLLNSLNRGVTLYGSNSSTPTICVEGSLDSLVLSDSLVGDLFEWVDSSTKKELRVKEEDGLVVKVVKKETITDPLSITKFEGPNTALLEVLNRRILRYRKNADERNMDKDYLEVTTESGTKYVDKDYEDEYNAVMVLSQVLDKEHVLRGAGSGDVLDLRMKVKVGRDKVSVPMYIKKSDINVILQYINIFRCFAEDFELPNELYQMKIDGAGYAMKELPSSVTGDRSIPEPKTASETYSTYEDRLKARFGEPVVAPGATFREPYLNETYDYSSTVRAHTKKIPMAPESGVSVDSLTPLTAPNTASRYYDHMKANSGAPARSRRPVVEDSGFRFVRSESDVPLKHKIADGFKTLGNFAVSHKGAILTALLVAGGITFVAFHPGLLVTLGKVFLEVMKQLAVAIPNVFIKGWGGLTVLQKWEFIGEMVLVVLGGQRLIKHLLKKRKARKEHEEEEVITLTDEELAARIAENERNIADLEGTLISLRNNYDSVIDEAERRRISISIERAEAQIRKAKLQITKDQNTLSERHEEELDTGGYRI